MKKTEFKIYASWNVLRYFIPITIISTPLGQITGDVVPIDLIEMIAGVLVTFVAIFEMYQKRKLFGKHIRKIFFKGKKTNDSDIDKWDEENPEISTLDRGSGLSISDEEEETRTAGFSDTYELGKTLGEGAFSIVKEGTMKSVASSSFAIKIVDKTSILEEEEARLGEEIALLKDVNHENILCLHKVYDETQAYYLVSDIMHGGDLLTRLNHIGFFPEGEACRIAKSVLDAVR